MPIRGDIGVRYVMTDQFASGIIPIAAPATSIYTSFGQYNEVERDYNDTLPAFNVVFELTDNLLARLSGSKVMSRPELGNLSPTAGVTATTRTGNVNNPYLDPIRADTADLALEWYFSEGSLLSVAYFYKDIESYIQRITEQVPYRELGLPDSLLDGTPASPTRHLHGGTLREHAGWSAEGLRNQRAGAVQLPAELLEQLRRAGQLHGGRCGNRVLHQRHRRSASTTISWSACHRPPRPARCTTRTTGSASAPRPHIVTSTSVRFRLRRAVTCAATSRSTYVDAQASWFVNDNLTIMLEAQNLTGERSTLYIDDSRERHVVPDRDRHHVHAGCDFKF